jgi:hypothetical protein
MAFEYITTGPSNASGDNSNGPNALGLDQQNNLVSSVGTSFTEQLMSAVLAVFQEQTALTTITTAQNLLSQALKSYFLNRLNRTLRIRGRGIYTSPGTTAPVLTFAVTLGGTSLVSISAAALSITASTNMPFEFDFSLSVAATGNAAAEIEAHGSLKINISANTPAGAIAEYLDDNTAVVGSLNLGEALTLDVTIASTLTLTSAQLLFATIEVSGS